jgi:hypothetical protein
LCGLFSAGARKNTAIHAENVDAIHRIIIAARTFGAARMETRHSLWQRLAMIAFRRLPDGHPDLAHSPLLRGALLTLQYAQEHGSIGLTKTKAFKRVFVHWAVEHFSWPGKSAEEMFRYSKVINEYEFPTASITRAVGIQHWEGKAPWPSSAKWPK